MNDLEPFARLAAALAPWRDQIVYVGGWAHRLYRLHPVATADPRFRPIATLDADIAFDEHTRFQGSMKDALLAAGFREQLCGEYRPPVAKYTLGDERHGFYAEFLTTLSGSGRTRKGAPSVTLDASGISAQKLRRFSLLMALPWRVSIAAGTAGLPVPLHGLRIPNPVSFIAQKILIRDERRRQRKLAQDILYIHDAIVLFADRASRLAVLWRDDVAHHVSARERAEIVEGIEALFGEVTDELRAAARIPVDRLLVPREMQAICRQWLGDLYGRSA
ncbi:GSU2403 family nucleotidyltransferase fold protein [Burkholderia gladioli]|uniref:GSU2403 family nucleotidyltransferase fold protein n=1 Tax=Burkholderia gladioli TaxID=28095 RepID=UPI00163E7365|nr:GSU2403 family nucleotidyltransferase fold protein [Burkholderia gladioli]